MKLTILFGLLTACAGNVLYWLGGLFMTTPGHVGETWRYWHPGLFLFIASLWATAVAIRAYDAAATTCGECVVLRKDLDATRSALAELKTP